MMSSGRRERGIEAYARIFAVPEEEVPAAMSARVGPAFAEEAFYAAGGSAWWLPALTGRERAIAIITALASQGVSGNRLRTHIELGRQQGLGEPELTALMTLLAVYLGYARASVAMETVTEAFAPASPAGLNETA